MRLIRSSSELASSSVKKSTSVPGSPRARDRNAAICSRRTSWVGQNALALQPEVMPDATSHSIAGSKGVPSVSMNEAPLVVKVVGVKLIDVAGPVRRRRS